MIAQGLNTFGRSSSDDTIRGNTRRFGGQRVPPVTTVTSLTPRAMVYYGKITHETPIVSLNLRSYDLELFQLFHM